MVTAHSLVDLCALKLPTKVPLVGSPANSAGRVSEALRIAVKKSCYRDGTDRATIGPVKAGTSQLSFSAISSIGAAIALACIMALECWQLPADAGAARVSIEAQPILAVTTTACNQQAPPAHSDGNWVTSVVWQPSRVGSPCFRLGRNVLPRGAIVRIAANASCVHGPLSCVAPTATEGTLKIWFSRSGLAQLKRLESECHSDSRICPKTFGIGSLVLIYGNTLIAGPLSSNSLTDRMLNTVPFNLGLPPRLARTVAAAYRK